MRFSVVVPVYNVEDYLDECLASIAAQSYADLEIVLVNDGSTDDSTRILREFARSSRIPTKLVEKENQGLYLARNSGLKIADGDYVLMIDSDDMLAPNALELVSNRIDETGADIVLFESCRNQNYTDPIHVHLEEKRRYTGNEMREYLLKGTVRNALFTKVFLRELLPPVQNEERYLGFCLAEDLAYSLRIFDGCSTAEFIDKPLYYYRSNDASISRKANLRQLKDIDRMADILVHYTDMWSASQGTWMRHQALVKCCYLAFNYAETLCMTGSSDEIKEGLNALRDTECFTTLLKDFDFKQLERRDMQRCLSLVRAEHDAILAMAVSPKRLNASSKRIAARMKKRLSKPTRNL